MNKISTKNNDQKIVLWNMVCLALLICGGLLLLPGSIILAHFSTKWVVHGIVIGIVMIALGCEFMRSGTPTT